MTIEEQKELLDKYKLSQEEHDEIYNMIKRVWTFEKNPSKDKTLKALEGRPYVSTQTQKNGYSTGMEVIEKGREKEYEKVILTYPKRLQKIRKTLATRRAELNQKLNQTTTGIEKNNLEYQREQLEEEARQTLELLETWESKKKRK